MSNERDRLVKQRNTNAGKVTEERNYTTNDGRRWKTICIGGGTIALIALVAILLADPKSLLTLRFFSPTVTSASLLSSGRTFVSSGTVFEELYGYSRAVRSGDIIHVSGTVAAGQEGLVKGGEGNAAFQARYALGKIQVAIEQLGGTMEDVVRTRIYVSERRHALEVAEVHGEFFKDIRPANTLVLAKLIEDEYLVEIEAEAIVGSRQPK